MKTYQVTITEKLQMTVEVEAGSRAKRSKPYMEDGRTAIIFWTPSASRTWTLRRDCRKKCAAKDDSFLGKCIRAMLCIVLTSIG